MELDPQLLQFTGSLVAIFALAALARALGLGGRPKLASNDSVQRAASEVFDGFVVADCAVDSRGSGALARDQDGKIMVIKRHGNRFAGRVLDAGAEAVTNGSEITVDSGERRYGAVALDLDDPGPWADAINQLESADDA